MRMTRHLPSNQIHFNHSLHQQTLEQVESDVYLGMTITDNLEWGQPDMGRLLGYQTLTGFDTNYYAGLLVLASPTDSLNLGENMTTNFLSCLYYRF